MSVGIGGRDVEGLAPASGDPAAQLLVTGQQQRAGAVDPDQLEWVQPDLEHPRFDGAGQLGSDGLPVAEVSGGGR